MPHWPNPPRRVTFFVAAQSREAIGIALGAMLLFACMGLAAEWSRDDFRSPRCDWRLDACEQPSAAVATVRAIDRERDNKGRLRDRARVSYTFVDANNVEQFGVSWLPRGGLREGDHRGVEYLPDDTSVSRLRDSKSTDIAWWLPWYAGWIVLPLLLAFSAWLAHVWRVLVTLRNGVACQAIATELAVPEQEQGKRRKHAQRCLVRFRWRGPDGSDHEATQRPRLHSALGRALANERVGQPMATAFVICSEWAPQHGRLIATSEVREASA